MTVVDIAALLTSFAAVIASVTTAILAFRGKRVGEEVRDEVRTYNESTIGQLLAADETRRATAIPHDDRTAREQRHITDSPEIGPAQGPD